MSVEIETARQEWEEGSRRLAASRPDERVLAQVRLVTEELRRRIGLTFTLAELVEEYGRAERWVHQVLSERAPTPGWTRTQTLVEQAAFHAYARGAADYSP